MQLHESIQERLRTADERQRSLGSTILDRRSFHTFEEGGELFLYDVMSGNLAELNPFTRRLLELCASENSWTDIAARLAEEGHDAEIGACIAAVDELKEQGLFRFERIDTTEQQAILDSLWAHRPRRLQLLMAQMCNLKCLYCYEEHNGSNARRRLMSFEMAKECVDYLIERSGRRPDLQITFFGGEPLLNFKVMQQVVEYCETVGPEHGKRFTFETITNGSLLKPEIVDYFIEKRFMLMVSLDGYREMNNFNRPSVSGHDLYDTILRNARYADQAYKRSGVGLPVKVRANLTHEHHDLIRTVRFMESQGFTTIGVSTVENLPWAEGDLHALNEQDLAEVAAQREELMESGMQAVREGRKPSPYEGRILNQALQKVQKGTMTRGLRCGAGRNTNIVDTDGNIYPCHRYGDLENFILGNVSDRRLDREKTMGYYRSVNTASTAKCEDCWVRNICGGPCAWEVSHPTGKIHEPHEENCKRIRRSVEKSLMRRRELELLEAPQLAEAKSCGSSSCGC
ncbi:MAG: radical SAM protein [Bacteroidota bacterium]